MSLPPIPGRVWLGGIVALLLLGVVRIERTRRVIRQARGAPPSVVRPRKISYSRSGIWLYSLGSNAGSMSSVE